MPAITYTDWSGGLDRRLDIKVQDASRLWTLKEAYITTGKKIKKRPGLRLLSEFNLTGSHGLETVDNQLVVFVKRGQTITLPATTVSVDGGQPRALMRQYQLDEPIVADATITLTGITYADLFQGYPYVVAKYTADYGAGDVFPIYRHHYIDKQPTQVTITIASPGVVTWNAHGLSNGREVFFTTTGALPSGLNPDQIYYVVNATTDTFQVSDTFGGSAKNTSGTQSGVHTATAPTWIGDANVPKTISATKAASRVFAINGETVRYCAAGNARDWTTSSDAGFIATGLQQDTKANCSAVGTFEDALVVFFSEGAQIWDVAVDPSANKIRKRLYGIGISDAPLSLASFANDLVFLSRYGVRSMTVSQQTDRIDDTDVGVPIDSLVVPDISTSAAVANRIDTFGIWIHELGQYWLVLDLGATSKVWAYTYSKSSKIACWSEYSFPVRITAITTLAGKVYLRTASQLYEVSATQYTDNGTLVSVEAQMAYQDAKSPGVNKQVFGADYVLTGSPSIAFKYDPRDQTKETIAQQISGDTRPGDMIPVEVCAPAIAPVFRHALDEAFQVDAVTLYYHLLGTQ